MKICFQLRPFRFFRCTSSKISYRQTPLWFVLHRTNPNDFGSLCVQRRTKKVEGTFITRKRSWARQWRDERAISVEYSCRPPGVSKTIEIRSLNWNILFNLSFRKFWSSKWMFFFTFMSNVSSNHARFFYSCVLRSQRHSFLEKLLFPFSIFLCVEIEIIQLFCDVICYDLMIHSKIK